MWRMCPMHCRPLVRGEAQQRLAPTGLSIFPSAPPAVGPTSTRTLGLSTPPPGTSMSQLFISYRTRGRRTAPAWKSCTQCLFDRFGVGNVFLDKATFITRQRVATSNSLSRR